MTETIIKSPGISESEKFLSKLCEKTFLKLWAYPNPYKADRKELCDLLVVFENHVFIFFDRESRKFEDSKKDILIQWNRWKKEVIDKQIKTSLGARKYVQEHPQDIFLDESNATPFPIKIPTENLVIHNIIVAHGAKEACASYSDDNVSGSLAILYGKLVDDVSRTPFLVNLEKTNPVHIFDSHNLEIMLGELDTIYDFRSYLLAKEKAIKQYNNFAYIGEEDLLAHYFSNFDEIAKEHFIGIRGRNDGSLMIWEGEWASFIKSSEYKRRKEANRTSYLWDELIQIACQCVLDGDFRGNGNPFQSPSAVHEMAKESRFSRRNLSNGIINAIQNFQSPEQRDKNQYLTFATSSFYKGAGYVFLQLNLPSTAGYYENRRFIRREMLGVACGVVKNEYPHLKKVIGIAVFTPQYSRDNSVDFCLIECENWTEEKRNYYEERNKLFNFLKTNSLKKSIVRSSDFPKQGEQLKPPKIGRNEKCPCGSERKYKYCCSKT